MVEVRILAYKDRTEIFVPPDPKPLARVERCGNGNWEKRVRIGEPHMPMSFAGYRQRHFEAVGELVNHVADHFNGERIDD